MISADVQQQQAWLITISRPGNGEHLDQLNEYDQDILFFLNSGFPFLTDATTMSPTPASGNLFKRAPNPYGSMINNDLAPLLSAQLRTAPVGRPKVIRNLLPEAPPPTHMALEKHRQDARFSTYRVLTFC
jgi:hypothetical protein